MKIRRVGAEFHAGGRMDGRTGRQTDMTKLRVAFRNFANAPKNGLFAKNMYLTYLTYLMYLMYRMLWL